MIDIAKVKEYEPRKATKTHAVLWTGKAADLVGMPDFNDLVGNIIVIDGLGRLTLEQEKEEQVTATPRLSYIVHQSGRGFFIVSKEKFEEEYQLVPRIESGMIEGPTKR